MQQLEVSLGERSYHIDIGCGLLTQIGDSIKPLTRSRVLLVSNPTVYELYGEQVRQSMLDSGLDVHVALMPDGEEYKTVEQALLVLDQALQARLDRGSVIVALGGGVVGDLAGFVAAIFQRGIALVQVPTTLLAQVDSSVGGKVGVNHARGKNLIGAFHQPRLVAADLDTLDTLSARDYTSGLAEVVKYGAVCDASFFEYLEQHVTELVNRDKTCLQHVVHECCRIKSLIVAQDEHEGGLRTVLNLGHTFGHSLEKLGEYRDYRHGEAVAMGTAAAACLAVQMGLLKMPEARRIVLLLQDLGLPVLVPDHDVNSIFKGMLGDKKSVRDGLRFVLPFGIGRFMLVDNPEADMVLNAIRTAQQPWYLATD